MRMGLLLMRGFWKGVWWWWIMIMMRKWRGRGR
jgi:hypothetical protein